jgi:uncharacterized membrane protein
MSALVSGLILFLGMHSISIVAPRFRERAAERAGPAVWRAIFAIVSIVGLVLTVRGYADLRGQTAVLYQTPRWVQGITVILMMPVFPLLLAAYLPGVIRTVTRHPMLVAVKLWALAHLLTNGTLADVLLFGSLLTWAVVERISLKRREPRPVPALPAGRWNDLIAILAGLAIYTVMLNGGHAWLIGMPLVLR